MQAESTSESLNAALDAVQETLRHPAASIFKKPVDHVALKLVDYLTVIPNPVDLGTICKQLEAGRKSNWRRSSYSSAKDVISDSLRVFENCEVYNQNDAATRQVAEDARQVFLRAWQAAGLDGPKPKKPVTNQVSASKQDVLPSVKKQKQSGSSRNSGAAAEAPAKPVAEAEPAQPGVDPASCKPEAEIPARFSIEPGAVEPIEAPDTQVAADICAVAPSYCITVLWQAKDLVRVCCTEAGGLPLRLLDNFSLSGGKRGSQLMGLEALHTRGGTSLTLHGALLPAAGRAAKRDGDNRSSHQAY